MKGTLEMTKSSSSLHRGERRSRKGVNLVQLNNDVDRTGQYILCLLIQYVCALHLRPGVWLRCVGVGGRGGGGNQDPPSSPRHPSSSRLWELLSWVRSKSVRKELMLLKFPPCPHLQVERNYEQLPWKGQICSCIRFYLFNGISLSNKEK